MSFCAETDPANGEGRTWEEGAPAPGGHKNMTFITQDRITCVIMKTAGNLGAFQENPPIDPYSQHSADGGRTWSAETIIGIDSLNQRPAGLAGYNEIWVTSDPWGAYKVSYDRGTTWSDTLLMPDGDERYNSDTDDNGTEGKINLGTFPGDGEETIIAGEGRFGVIMWKHPYPDFTNEPWFGVMRTISNDPADGWEWSLQPDSVANGGSGLSFNWDYLRTIGYGGGVWIICGAGWSSVDDTGVLLRCTSADMDPGAWQAPTWPVSQGWAEDIYEGFASVLSRNLHPRRIRFIDNGQGGGRFWLLGSRDALAYSDDMGVTWNKSLADHAGNGTGLHPFINYRQQLVPWSSGPVPYGNIHDIRALPGTPNRLVCVGETYDRVTYPSNEGFNRHAVFCCSEDGGLTWGPVGRLPIPYSSDPWVRRARYVFLRCAEETP